MSFVPQIGMVELLMLAVLALVVVGPTDLPRLTRSVGKALGQMRKLADEFRASFDQMAREAEIEEMRAEIEALKKSADPSEDLKKSLADTEKMLNGELEEMEPLAGSSPAERARDDSRAVEEADDAVAPIEATAPKEQAGPKESSTP